jgi:hypothetical protein
MWGYLKHSRLANYAPRRLTELRHRLTTEFSALQRRQAIIASCVRKAGLGSSLE